jgi:hypothetical protein
MIEVIADLTKRSQGNPGAMQCLVDLISRPPEELMGSIKIIQQLDELEILGSDIYIFWNDLAGKDFQVMENLASFAPSQLLKEACSRQDRSGIELIKEWRKKPEPVTKT